MKKWKDCELRKLKKEPIKFWDIKNIANKSGSNEQYDAEILIYSDITSREVYDWWTGEKADTVYPKQFNEDLNALGDVDKIKLRINSNGGSVFAAIAITNMLKNHKAEIHTYIDGIAASAASVIAMAGDKIFMNTGSLFMVHQAMSYAFGNSGELREVADNLEKITNNIIDIYHLRTNADMQKLVEIVNKETYLTAEESKDLGFCDEILDTEVVASLSQDEKTITINGATFNSYGLSDKFSKFAAHNHKPENKNKEETKMKTIEELRNAHPDLVNAIVNEAEKSGGQKERQRIQEIETISANISDKELVNKAKFESCMSAKDLSFEALKNNKAKAENYLNSLQEDAKNSGAEDIEATTNSGNHTGGNSELDSILAAAQKTLDERKGQADNGN